MPKIKLTVSLMVMLICTASADNGQSFLVIAHSSTTLDSVSKMELQDIYLGRRRTWTSGERVILTHSQSGVAFSSFSRKVLQKSLRQFRMFWKRMALTGKGSMPKHLTSDVDAVRYVRNTPGAIAIVDIAVDRTKVKVLELAE